MIKKMNKNEIESAIDGIEFNNKDRFISFISLFKNGDYIYPSVISKIIKMPITDTIKILKRLEKKGVLKLS